MYNFLRLALVALLGMAYPGLCAQPTYTAHDHVPAYTHQQYFGTNLGWYTNAWPDERLANIAAGNPELGVSGVGVRNLRLSLPEHHLEKWGYHIEMADVEHYDHLGMREMTAFLQGPSEAHRLQEMFCPEQSLHLFENLYLPIWDDGTDGTPFNDSNYFARYVYLAVSQYKDHVRFWEILNEVDYTPTGFGWRPAGQEGSWFDGPPNPCHLKHLRAPVYYYIRMLRIAYEVIKTVDSTAYVAIGGIGYASFLDVVLRYTDNPEDGSPTADFPLTGGAYFDALSYHSYPANDGSMRRYDIPLGQFVYSRHSDAAANGVIRLKNDLQTVLHNRGYDGTLYPPKRCIVTECNVSRAMFGDQMGSAVGQRNFMPKALVLAKQQGIDQFYTFMLADKKTAAQATNAWDLMGLHYALAPVQPYQQQPTPAGVAFHTAADFLHEYAHTDTALTTLLQLPDHIRGGVFTNDEGNHLIVLWAKTDTDQWEGNTTTYTLPAAWHGQMLSVRRWDHSATGLQEWVPGATPLTLEASPTFVLANGFGILTRQQQTPPVATLSPNLLGNGQSEATLAIHLATPMPVSAMLFGADGRLLGQPVPTQALPAGTHTWPLPTAHLPAGLYLCRITTPIGTTTLKLLCR